MQHSMQKPVQHRWWERAWRREWIGGALALFATLFLLVGFRANPAPQPQRLSDLLARIEALEAAQATQQAQLDDLAARLEALEATAGTAEAIVFDPDVTIPRGWQENTSSDGMLRYWFDPRWERTAEEPGAVDLWLDDNTALFFTWDWSADLVKDLHGDEEALRFFEKDMFSSDEEILSEIVAAGALRFMGDDAHYWDIRSASVDGFTSRMLTIFYPCSDRVSCNITLLRYDPNQEDETPVADFAQEDWDLLNTFAHGVTFLTDGKTTVTGNANLRACPAVECEIVGRVMRGDIIELVAVSEDGYWYQLDSGAWIAAHMIFDAPDDLPVISAREEV